MTQAPPVPAANQSPYPLRESPHPPTPPKRTERPASPSQPFPWLALLGAGTIAVIGGALLMRRR